MFFKIFAWSFVFGQPEFNIFLFTIDRLLISLLAASVLFFCNYIHGDYTISKLAANIPNINLVWTVIDRVGLSLYIVHPAVIIGSTVIRKQPMTFDIIPIVSPWFLYFLRVKFYIEFCLTDYHCIWRFPAFANTCCIPLFIDWESIFEYHKKISELEFCKK